MSCITGSRQSQCEKHGHPQVSFCIRLSGHFYLFFEALLKSFEPNCIIVPFILIKISPVVRLSESICL